MVVWSAKLKICFPNDLEIPDQEICLREYVLQGIYMCIHQDTHLRIFLLPTNMPIPYNERINSDIPVIENITQQKNYKYMFNVDESCKQGSKSQKIYNIYTFIYKIFIYEYIKYIYI